MAETLGPGVLDDPFAPDLSLEERLRALESAWAEPGPVPAGADQRLAAQTARLEALAAEVVAQRERLRDQEKSLVERIADVDDDRRLTSSQLQRGWQAQREEFEARVRRHGRASALVLALALAGGGLLALYLHSRAAPAALAGEVAGLRQDLQRLSGLVQQDAQLQERLAALASAVGDLSTRQRRGTKPAEPLPAAEGPALAERLERLTTEQRRQGAELDALQRAVQALAAAAPSRAVPAPDPAAGSRPPKSAAPAPDPVPGLAAPDAAPATTAPITTTQAPPRFARTLVTDRPFALQLLGGYNRAKLLELAVRPDLPDPVYLRAESRRGRPWFVLIHSLHASNAEAQAALAKLPADLRAPSPWIRDLPRGVELEVVKRASARR